jgi:carbonic anhydrase
MSAQVFVRSAVVLLFAAVPLTLAGQSTVTSKPVVQTRATQAALSPAGALQMLKEGNARFVNGHAIARDLRAQQHATSEAQYPFAAIVGCMDSRVPNELVFDQGIGDIFSIRVAGNIVDPDVIGSVEYSTKAAGAKLVVVLGHTQCGAVKGAIDNVQMGSLTQLLAKIRTSVGSGRGTSKDQDLVEQVTLANVRESVRELRNGSPLLKALLDAHTVNLVGGVYSVETGRVTFDDQPIR